MSEIQRDVWRIALPMMLAGVSTPLIGLVDTAVLGHLDSHIYLAAVAVGAVVFSLLFWMFGFLRMACSGQTANYYGAQDHARIKSVLLQTAMLAMILATILLLLQLPLESFMLSFYTIEADVATELVTYYSIRIWSAPATLLSYVLMGWMLGMQMVRQNLYLVICINFINLLLDLLFVVGWGMNTAGVAWATVIAEYAGLMLGIGLVWKRWQAMPRQPRLWLPVRQLLAMNLDMFVRTFCLLLVFLIFSWQGARYGSVILAVNALLLNFQTFMAYVLDAFAHAAETLVGEARGCHDRDRLLGLVRTTGYFSFWLALGFALAYWWGGNQIIAGLSSLPTVQLLAGDYLIWLALMPLAAFVSYWLDGVYIGLGWFRSMRRIMLWAVAGFVLVWQLLLVLGNHGLWGAMILFLLLRSILMLAHWKKHKPLIS